VQSARSVDENSAHRFRRRRKEMAMILPLLRHGLIDQSVSAHFSRQRRQVYLGEVVTVCSLSKENLMGRKNSVSREAVWRRRLARFGRGSWTVAEFCRREDVSMPTFYHWRKRLGPAAGKSPARDVQVQRAQPRRDTSPFVAVSVATPAIAEIEFPNGVRIRVPATNDQALRAAVRAGCDLCQAEVTPC
jgi:transposase-like protein